MSKLSGVICDVVKAGKLTVAHTAGRVERGSLFDDDTVPGNLRRCRGDRSGRLVQLGVTTLMSADLTKR